MSNSSPIDKPTSLAAPRGLFISTPNQRLWGEASGPLSTPLAKGNKLQEELAKMLDS
jgi:hypothetical protein